MMIKQLRKLGGTWKAEQMGFGVYWYFGSLDNHEYHVRSYAQLAPRYDGDDDSFQVVWQVHRDGHLLSLLDCGDPVMSCVQTARFRGRTKKGVFTLGTRA